MSTSTSSVSKSPLKSQIHAENYDDIEESLRNDLRRDSHVSNTDSNKELLHCENSYAKYPSFITVCEQQNQAGNFRNIPNMTENIRPHPIGPSSPLMRASSITSTPDLNQEIPRTNVDEFKRYCSLLTERIRKVEEQNLELLRIAERQKFEYDKVVTQVVESEQSQRLLINECCDLRQQVQHLTNYNRKLKDEQNNAFHASDPKDSKIQADLKQADNASQVSSHSQAQAAEILKYVQPCNEPILGSSNSSPALSAALQLIAALQLAGQSPQQRLTREVPSSPSHAKTQTNTDLKFIPERRLSNQTDLSSANIQRFERLNFQQSSPSGCQTSNQQLTSANFGSSKIPEQPQIVNLRSAQLRSESRLRSHSNLKTASSKHRSRPRPASLVMDSEFSLVRKCAADSDRFQQQNLHLPAQNLTPNSTPGSPQRLNPRTSRQVKPDTYVVQDFAVANSTEESFGIWQKRKSASSLSLLDEKNQDQCTQVVANEQQNFKPDTRSENYAQLPKNFADVPKRHSKRSNKSSPSNQPRNNRTSLDETTQQEDELTIDVSISAQPVMKEIASYENANTTKFEEQKQDNGDIARRRHSYGKACRKSQSMDHLSGAAPELSLPPSTENNPENDRYSEEMEALSSFDYLDEMEAISSFDDIESFNETSFSSANETCNDSGFISPKSQQVHHAISNNSPLSKTQQENPSSTEAIRSNMKTKALSTENQTNANETHSIYEEQQNKSHSYDSKVDLEEQIVCDTTEALSSGHNFRNRVYSEGSIGPKKKGKVNEKGNKRQLQRQTSVGSNLGKKNATKPIIPLVSEPMFDSFDDEKRVDECELVSDEGFIITNDFQLSSTGNLDDEPKDIVPKFEKKQAKSLRGLKQPLSIGSPKTATPLSSPEKRELAASGDLKRNKLKSAAKRSKSTNVLMQKEGKKSVFSSGNQSKSLVNIVKSKFGRSSSTAKLSLTSKKTSLETPRQGPVIIKPIKPAMKPVLSLENVAYLPPGKDGDKARKQAKQKLIRREETAAHIDFSATNSDGDISPKDSVRRASEDMLSDEGFADGSTIERSETEENPLPEDINMLRSKIFSKSSSGPKTNTVSSTESENSVCDGFKPKEITSLQAKQMDYDSKRASFDESRLSEEIFNCFEAGVDPATFSTEVTLVPTSALSQTNRALTPTSRLKTKKLAKPQSGNALGRLIKNVSNQYAGSKDDINQTREYSKSFSQVKEHKRGKLSYQRNMEQAFMSSIVQAELTQSLQERSNSPEPLSRDRANGFRDNLSYSTSNDKSNASTGTGSSVGSSSSFGSSSSEHGIDSQPSSCEVTPPKSALQQKASKPPSGLKYAGNKKVIEKTASCVILPESRPRANTSNLPETQTDVRLGKIRAMSMANKSGLSSSPQKTSQLRNSKLAAPSKLSPTGNSAGLIKSKLKQKSSLPSSTNQVGKTKLAPLNYGFSPVQDNSPAKTKLSSKTTSNKTSVAQNEPQAVQTQTKAKSSLSAPRNIKPALKLPVARSAARCAPTALEGPKVRSNIPSTGIYRPKPVSNIAT